MPIDARVAFRAFELGCQAPGRLPLTDALIAAAACENGARLVHRDRHFRDIPPASVDQLDLGQ